MGAMKHHLLLIDLPNLLMRVYYRMEDRRWPRVGQHAVNAVRGAVRQQEATLCVAALDPRDGYAFGYDIYPDYKLKPEGAYKSPEEQGPTAREITEEVWPYLYEAGICMVEKSGYEADHIIATVTKRAVAKKSRVTILSRDRDLFALVRDGSVRCLYPEKGQEHIIREKDVLLRMGVRPEQIEDLKIMAGDKSDNIPRIGEWDRSKKPYGFTDKRAATLIGQYGSLSNILKRIEELPERERNWLQTDADAGELGWKRELIKLRKNVPLEIDPREAAVEYMGITA